MADGAGKGGAGDVRTQGEELLGGIDDFILAIADGVQRAQEQLSRVRVPGPPGQPPTAYYVPRVDFELKLAFEIVDETQGRPGPTRPGRGALRPGIALRARTLGPEHTATGSFRGEAASVIKGSVVAVPAEGGRPPPVLRARLEATGPAQVAVVVTARSAVGEPLAGLEVQLNVDRELSAEMNRAEGLAADLAPGTDLRDGVLVADAEGRAATVLDIDPAEPAGAGVAIVVEAAGRLLTLVYRVERRSP